MEHTTKLISKEIIAEGTMAFHLEKPEGFIYKAGQNADFTLTDPEETDAEGNTRTFSFTSSPSEAVLSFATRMRDTAFKRILKAAPAGLPIVVNGPMGSFTLHEKAARPAVLLAGGIGVTPFISMVKDAAERKLLHKIHFFYSNRRPQDAAFLSELKELSGQNPNLNFVPTMTETKEAYDWQGERGYIDKAMIERHAPGLAEAVYYIAGPQTMVEAIRKMLNDAGVSNDDIRTEEFAGY
jgi:ferredoxin-NADP reductase